MIRKDHLAALYPSAFQAAAPIVMALMECDDEIRAAAVELIGQLNGGDLDREQRHATAALLADMLFPAADAEGLSGVSADDADTIDLNDDPTAGEVASRMDRDEAIFADRLRQVMDARGMTPAELAAKVGICQPTVSMMLNRACRPQRKTVAQFAAALGVAVDELWPAVQD